MWYNAISEAIRLLKALYHSVFSMPDVKKYGAPKGRHIDILWS